VHSRELELRRASVTSSLEMSESVVRRKVTRGGSSFEGFQDFLRTSINLPSRPDAVLDGAETTAGQGEGGGRHALRCIGACVARHRWFHVWLMDASFGCRRPPPPLR